MDILKRIRKIKQAMIKTLEVVVMLATAVLVLDVIWQVFTRYVLKDPSTWTEELATMLLMWVALLGACVAFNRKGHLGVDYFVSKLSVKNKIAVELFTHLVVAFFAIIIIYGGYRIVAFTLLTNQLSAALEIKMGYVYLVLPISGLFILAVAIETAIEKANTLLTSK